MTNRKNALARKKAKKLEKNKENRQSLIPNLLSQLFSKNKYQSQSFFSKDQPEDYISEDEFGDDKYTPTQYHSPQTEDEKKRAEIFCDSYSEDDPICIKKWERYELTKYNPDLLDLDVLDSLMDPRILDRDADYIWEEGDVYFGLYDYIDHRWEKVYLKTVELYKSYNRVRVPNTSRHSKNYCETHHIHPKCLGGEDTPENTVIVTLDEHRVLYALLVLTYPFNTSIYYAYQLMTRRREDVGIDKFYWEDEYFERLLEMDKYLLSKRDKADIGYYLLERNKAIKE